MLFRSDPSKVVVRFEGVGLQVDALLELSGRGREIAFLVGFQARADIALGRREWDSGGRCGQEQGEEKREGDASVPQEGAWGRTQGRREALHEKRLNAETRRRRDAETDSVAGKACAILCPAC